MEKQKICIIGGNLTGLVTAIALSKLNCQIDLITGNANLNHKSNRTIAISEDNFDFLNKLNIKKSLKEEMWPCSIMKLYTEIRNEKFSKIFELNNNNKQKKIFYMVKNSKIMKFMISKIKKIKSISIKSHEKISEISTSGLLKSVKINNNKFKYNLIIICAGNNSSLVKNLFTDQIIENSYKETSITAILSHNPLKNNIARQIFLDDGILINSVFPSMTRTPMLDKNLRVSELEKLKGIGKGTITRIKEIIKKGTLTEIKTTKKTIKTTKKHLNFVTLQ